MSQANVDTLRELFARYNQEQAVDAAIMGYSAAGVVEAVGAAVTEFRIGDRVTVVAPHAEYVVGEVDSCSMTVSVWVWPLFIGLITIELALSPAGITVQ